MDGDSSNTVEDNLAFLCFAHHEEAERTSPLIRKLTPGVIRRYRSLHYQAIANERKKVVGLMDQPIHGLTEGALIEASLTATILLDVIKIEAEYYATSRTERADVLSKLGIYADYTNYRVALAVLQLLSSVSHMTRSGSSEEHTGVISSLVYNFFPSAHGGAHEEQIRALAKLCIDAGNSIVYDAVIHLRDLRVALPGLTVLKFIHRQGVHRKMQALVEDVSEAFDWLEASMSRPDRDDLGVAMDMIKFYRTDLEDDDLSYPMFPLNVMNAIHYGDNS
ncbi:MAG: hypothetical protein QM724_09890 [Flavobacteriales bacterium]